FQHLSGSAFGLSSRRWSCWTGRRSRPSSNAVWRSCVGRSEKRVDAMAADANRHAVLPTRPTARILPAAEARAWQDGFVLLETARREAQQTRDRARHAYASEYARGYDDGKAAGDADAARLVAETVAKVDHYLAGLKAEVAGLAVDIVKRVLGEFEVSDLVAHAADRAIADIRRARFIRLSIHPDVLDAVRSRLGPML